MELKWIITNFPKKAYENAVNKGFIGNCGQFVLKNAKTNENFIIFVVREDGEDDVSLDIFTMTEEGCQEQYLGTKTIKIAKNYLQFCRHAKNITVRALYL